MKVIYALSSVLALTFVQAAAAADSAVGREKAVKCKQCHGLDGLGKLPEAPNIAGQKEEYMITQLRAFRDGTRKNDMMSFITKNLSDEDIANLSAYYASIKIEVTVPE